MKVIYRTFDEWSALGYRIHKGEHAARRSDDNKPLFSNLQVWCPKEGDMDMEEDADWASAFGIPWGD